MDYSSLAVYLVVFVLASQAATCLPINQQEYEEQEYADYVSNAVNDTKTVLNCFLANINSDEARLPCWRAPFDSIQTGNLTRRENATKTYHDWLEDSLSAMDIPYMEHCYYDYLPTPWYRRDLNAMDKIFCNLIVNKALNVSHPLLVPLRAMFDDYTEDEKSDLERVWDCFVKNLECTRYEGHPLKNGLLPDPDCHTCFEWYLTSTGIYHLASLNHTRRYTNVKSFNERLIKALVDLHFTSHYREIEHCALYHRAQDWYGCPKEFYHPKPAPSNDEPSILYHLAMRKFGVWVIRQFDKKQIDRAFVYLSMSKQLQSFYEHVAPLKPILDRCADGSGSQQCEDILRPVSGYLYKPEDVILQKVWKLSQALVLQDDCKQYHNDSNYDAWDKCKDFL